MFDLGKGADLFPVDKGVGKPGDVERNEPGEKDADDGGEMGDIEMDHAVVSLKMGPATAGSRDSVPASGVWVMRSKMSSGSSGISLKAMPVACSMALRMAGAGPSMGSSPMPLAPKAPWGDGDLFEGDVDGREVGAGGHDVVGHLVVGEVAVAPEALLVESVADALGDAAFDLAGGEDGMEDFADFLERVEVGDGCGVGGGVDGDFGDVDGPGVGGIGFAAVGFVVPEDVAGGFVAGFGLERAVLGEIAEGGTAEVLGSVVGDEMTAGDEGGAEGLCGALDEFADDHGGAAGYGGAGVGDADGVGLGDEDVVVREAKGLGGNLAEDGVGALAELGGGDEDARLAFGSEFDGDEGVEAAFAGAGEACAVEEGGEAYASLDGAGGVFAVELLAFGVVVGLFERSGEQVLHVDGVVEELAGGGAVAGGEEVAAAEFFGGEADDFGDLVHVAFEGEDALRGAESAEGSVRRDVGCHRFGADGHIGPVVGAGSVDGASGEDYWRERGVGSAVDGEVDLSGEEFAVFADCGAVAGA